MGGYNGVDPKTGQLHPANAAKPQWKQWPLSPVSTAASATVTQIKSSSAQTLLVPPGHVVTGLQLASQSAESSKSAVYYDTDNLAWYVTGEYQGMLRAAVRPALSGELRNIPRVKVVGGDQDW